MMDVFSSFVPYHCQNQQEFDGIFNSLKKIESPSKGYLKIVLNSSKTGYQPILSEEESKLSFKEIAIFFNRFMWRNIDYAAPYYGQLERFRFLLNKADDALLEQEFENLLKRTSALFGQFILQESHHLPFEDQQRWYCERLAQIEIAKSENRLLIQQIEDGLRYLNQENVVLKNRNDALEIKLKRTCDTVVLCADGEVLCSHLAFDCPVFRNSTYEKLSSHSIEIVKNYRLEHPDCVHWLCLGLNLKSFSKKIIEMFVEFYLHPQDWYKDDLHIEDLKSLIVLADYLNHTLFLRACVKEIRENLTIDQVIPFFNSCSLAKNSSIPLLINSIVQFIALHFDALCDTGTFFHIDHAHLLELCRNPEFHTDSYNFKNAVWLWALRLDSRKHILLLYEEHQSQCLMDLLPIPNRMILADPDILNLMKNHLILNPFSTKRIERPMCVPQLLPMECHSLGNGILQLTYTLDLMVSYSNLYNIFVYEGKTWKIKLVSLKSQRPTRWGVHELCFLRKEPDDWSLPVSNLKITHTQLNLDEDPEAHWVEVKTVIENLQDGLTQ